MSTLKAEHRKALFSANAGGATRDMSAIAATGGMGFFGQGQHALPVDADQFIGAFGPSTPAAPSPLDPVLPGQAISLPRRNQYAVGYNLPTAPGAGKLLDFASLRNLAKVYDVLRRCIEIRKQEIASLDRAIVPLDPKQAVDVSVVKELDAFFDCPDPIRGLEWDDWIKLALEEMLVVDALSIYPHPTWLPGRGRLGSDLFALEILDGSTIKPLIDIRGSRPQPPAPAFQQFLYGVPRTEMMADRVAAALGATDPGVLDKFSSAQLYYRPYHPQPDSLYGFSNVEQIIINVNLALKRQQWWTAWFTDGTIPAGLLHVPEDWGPTAIREYEELWNSQLAGDMQRRQQVRAVPGAVGFTPLRPVFGEGNVTQFDEWLAKITCIGMDVTPTEIGFDPKGGLGGAGWSEMQENVNQRKSLKPVTRWLERLFYRIISDRFGRPDYCLRFQYQEIEDGLKKAQMNTQLFSFAQRTPNELRQADGLDPLSEPNANKLMVVTRLGPVLLEDVDAASKNAVGLNRDGSAKTLTPALGTNGLPPADPSQDADPAADDDGQDDDGQDAVPARGQDAAKAVSADLVRWRRKATKAVRGGRPALVDFASEAIPSELHEAITMRLKSAATLDDVSAAFGGDAVREAVLERLQKAVGAELVARTE